MYAFGWANVLMDEIRNQLEDVLAVVGNDSKDDTEFNRLVNTNPFYAFPVKVHSFAFSKAHTDIIRDVASGGTSGRIHRGMLCSRMFFDFRREGDYYARKGILVCSPER